MIKNSLTGKQKRFLRAMGTSMDPVVFIGKEGLTTTVVTATKDAIKKRELIKVRVLQNCLEDPEDAITTLADRCNCNLVQIIGHNGLLFARNYDKPKIELPK